MRILEVLTYYRPHTSGLTIYVERLSRALAELGHDVTVLTSQFDPDLPRTENMHGVNIVRVPVALRVSKGVIMPTFGRHANQLARWADVLHLHLPQFDAPGLAVRGRLFRKPVVLTYHCDLQLPEGAFNRLVDRVVRVANRMAGNLADAVVTYTRDYGANSPYLSPYMGGKLHIIPPPIELAACTPEELQTFVEKRGIANHKVIGISARIAAEKGVEILLRALPKVLEAHPDVLVLHANPQALGEEAYLERLQPLFDRHHEHYRLLGSLSGAELTAFYRSLDVLVVSSLNSTESFGLVQIEAMMNGVPVAACDLPGVRQPVIMTGMGEVTPVGDSDALAEALIRLLDCRERYLRPADVIAASFSTEQTAREYAALFSRLVRGERGSGTVEPEAYERLRLLNREY